jgi:hypothetical protein
MKLSKRETTMLLILLIIALAFVEFRLILTPGMKNLTKLSAEKDELELQYQNINFNLTLAKTNEQKRDEYLASINTLAEPYLDGVTPDSLLVFTHEMLIKHGFSPFNYKPSARSTVFLQPEQAAVVQLNYRMKEIAEEYNNLGKAPDPTDQPTETNGNVEGINDMMELFSMQITANGTYEQIKALLDDFDSLGKTVMLTDISLNPVDTATGLLNANFTVNYFGITKLVSSDDPLNEWTRETQPTATNDPFSPGAKPSETTTATTTTAAP